jgi:hypothetical protein
MEALGKGIARYGQRQLIWGVVALSSLMLLACASPGGVTAESPPDVKKAAVTERANARWKAVIDGDGDKAYEFLSSGSKTVTSLTTYKARARLVGFRAADLQSVACEPEVCKVKYRVTLDHRLMKGISSEVEETWVLEKGQYWYVWRL